MGRDPALLELHIRVGYVLLPWLFGHNDMTSSVNSSNEVAIVGLWTATRGYNVHLKRSTAQ